MSLLMARNRLESERCDMTEDAEFQRRLQRVEVLIQAADALPDPAARECVRELIHAVLDMHRVGLARVWELISKSDEGNEKLSDQLLNDSLVSSLLLLHELHPMPLEERVTKTLENLRPMLESYSCTLEVLGVSAELVHVKICGDGEFAGIQAGRVRPVVEESILAVAPDVAHIQVDEPAESRPDVQGKLLSLSVLAR